MPQVDYTEGLKLLVGELNAGGSDAWTTAVADKKQSGGMLKECLLLGDADAVGLYLDNPLSDYGEPFLVLSDELDHGVAVPAHTGVVREIVFVKVGADDSFVRSTRAPSRQQIERWRRNHNQIYGAASHDTSGSPLGGFHRLEDGFVYFTGSKAKLKLPQFEIDRATPKCQADARHTSYVVARAVMHAHKEGYVSDWLFAEKSKMWDEFKVLILGEADAGGS